MWHLKVSFSGSKILIFSLQLPFPISVQGEQILLIRCLCLDSFLTTLSHLKYSMSANTIFQFYPQNKFRILPFSSTAFYFILFLSNPPLSFLAWFYIFVMVPSSSCLVFSMFESKLREVAKVIFFIERQIPLGFCKKANKTKP